MGYFDHLPTLADVNATRRAVQKGAEPSRLQVKAAKATDERKEEAAWRKAVIKRDGLVCRWCRRKVECVLALAPERAEVHHISGRVVRAIRWDRRNGAVFCQLCHSRLTGKVGEKFLIHSKHTFSVDGIQYINADRPFTYKCVTGPVPTPQEDRP